MTEITNAQVLQAIGLAVISSQLFEKIFVITARFAIKQADIRVFEEIESIEMAAAYKQPIRALLKEISGKLQIVDLEERIGTLIEDRNRVVHRLTDETPWPRPITLEQQKEVLTLCVRVATESITIADALKPLLNEWMQRFPEIKLK